METRHSIQYLRKRKFLLILPLLIFAFSTLGFYALGGGRKKATNSQANRNPGLNTSVPMAKFDKHEKPKDKMSFYAQASLDSERQQSNNNNPLLRKFGFQKDSRNIADLKTPANSNPLTSGYTDPNVTRINQKLAAINQQINQPQMRELSSPTGITNNAAPNKDFNQQVNKLETMMKAMNSSQGNDPQMQQLSKMLGQIQAIQHPELTKSDAATGATVSESPFRAIPAVIDGKQKVLQGGAVKLRLNDSLIFKGTTIPKGTLIFGTATITNQRLLLEIKNIRLNDAIIPVNLTVYSLDGMPGIPAPEAELAGAAGSGANDAIENMQFLSMDPSLATQAAAGGINAAKGLFSKKVKKIKVKLQNEYPVLLKINK
jgi:hypothetical protein